MTELLKELLEGQRPTTRAPARDPKPNPSPGAAQSGL
jgi:hypothetical protein